MNWKIDKGRPVCPQIEEQISIAVANGEFKSGEKLMSVREIAVAASVNPNTVQKAFEGLEAKGLLVSRRGSGWYVSKDTEKATETVRQIISAKTAEYLSAMEQFGLSEEEIITLIKERKE